MGFQADLCKTGLSNEILNIDKWSAGFGQCLGLSEALTTNWHLSFVVISTLLMNTPKGRE